MEQIAITGGVLVPLYSPCDEEGHFLPDEFSRVMEGYLSAPIDGFYVCGGTGQGLLMTAEERKLACELAVSIAKPKGKATLVQIGAADPTVAADLAAHAAKAGADGISSVPLTGADKKRQQAYYNTITAASGLPTILYYVPGCDQSLSDVQDFLRTPGVTGIKSSTNDFFFTMQLMEAKGQDRILFNGKDEYLAAAVAQGAEGGIGMWASVFPQAYAAIFHRAAAGDLNGAFAIQTVLNHLCCIVFRYGLLPAFETILRHLGRWDRVFRGADRFDAETERRFLAEAEADIRQLLAIEA